MIKHPFLVSAPIPMISEEERFKSDLNAILKKIFLSDDQTALSLSLENQRATTGKRVKCKSCIDKYHPSFVNLHKKHFCGRPLKELGLVRIGPGNLFQCIKCEEGRVKKDKNVTSVFYESYNLAMFHARYLCGLDCDKASDFRCIYCQQTVLEKEFMLHARKRHGRNLENILAFLEVILAENMRVNL